MGQFAFRTSPRRTWDVRQSTFSPDATASGQEHHGDEVRRWVAGPAGRRDQSCARNRARKPRGRRASDQARRRRQQRGAAGLRPRRTALHRDSRTLAPMVQMARRDATNHGGPRRRATASPSRKPRRDVAASRRSPEPTRPGGVEAEREGWRGHEPSVNRSAGDGQTQ
jgi:hypothetical protein